MLPPFQPSTIHILAFGKMLLFAVLGVGLWTNRKIARRCLLAAGAVIAAIVTLQVVILWQTPLPFGGLQGDEALTTAFYQRVITDGIGHDLTYAKLPAFYPPLWFYSIGGIARMFGLTGVGAAKLAGVIASLVIPLLSWWFWRTVRRDSDGPIANPLFPLLLTLTPFLAVDFPSVLAKPYEFASALGVLLWFTVVRRFLAGSERQLLHMLAIGVLGAALFTTYYLWFVMVGIAVLTFLPWRNPRSLARELVSWGAIGGVVALGSLWYWWPLAASYVRHGMENWQPAFFIASDLNFFPPVEFTPRSAWLWVGLVALVAYRRRPLIRPALQLLLGCYVWQAVTLVATMFGDAPFQGARGFTFFGEIILAYGAAYGLTVWIAGSAPAQGFTRVAAVLRERFSAAVPQTGATKFLLAWIAIAVSLPFGLWLDQESTAVRLAAVRQGSVTAARFADYFRTHPEDAKRTALSFFPPLQAQVALPQFISYNQHYSHPAARFSERLRYLRILALAKTPAQFSEWFHRKNVFDPIEQLILYGDGDDYLLYLWLDDYPNGGREEVIRWPKRLIAEPYFRQVPELSFGGFSTWRVR
ncbi:MAG: arabinofuranosyltransferase [Parcubacteria group bacterium Gr01-1014_31]|nr:MAG: arabinofuranosyltransferase [Parcubacteria group bacterium Gr01-1014_31]